MRQVGACCALLVALPFAADAQTRELTHRPIQAQRRLALIIGNSAYPRAPLKNPVNDARAMAEVLTKLRFEVTEVHEMSLREMGKLIDQFTDRLETGDVGFFYFAGHGLQAQQENYLVPVDFAAATEAKAKYAAYSASRVRNKMEGSGARLRILVLDACRNNPFRDCLTCLVSKREIGLASMRSEAEGTLIAFATGDNAVAEDSPAEGNGLFTKYLVAALQIPGLSLDEVFKRVKEDVSFASNRRQTPYTYDNIVGRFYFQEASATRENRD